MGTEPVRGRVTRSRLPLAVASVLAGVAVLFVVLGAVFNLVLVAAAVPFAVATYLLWSHATGRLEARVRPSAFESGRAGRSSARRGPGWTGPTGERPAAPDVTAPSMDRREALDVLGLESDADQRAIQRAYRDRVKAVHPDAADGDEAAFRRVRAAYDQLRGGKR